MSTVRRHRHSISKPGPAFQKMGEVLSPSMFIMVRAQSQINTRTILTNPHWPGQWALIPVAAALSLASAWILRLAFKRLQSASWKKMEWWKEDRSWCWFSMWHGQPEASLWISRQCWASLLKTGLSASITSISAQMA